MIQRWGGAQPSMRVLLQFLSCTISFTTYSLPLRQRERERERQRVSVFVCVCVWYKPACFGHVFAMNIIPLVAAKCLV